MGIDLFRGLTPRVSQKRILESKARHLMVGGPVGPGKTLGCLWKVFWLNLNFPKNFFFIGRWVEEHIWETTLPSWKEAFPIEEFGHIMRYIGGDRQPDGVEIAARDPNNPEVLSWDYKSVIRFVPLAVTKRMPGGQIGGFLIEQAEQCPSVEIWTDLTRRMRRKCIPYAMQQGLGTANYEGFWAEWREFFIDHKIENRQIPPEFADNMEYIEATGEETDQNFGAKYRREQMALLPPLKAKTLIQGIDVRSIGKIYKSYNEEIHVRDFEFKDVAEERGGLNWIVAYDYGMSPDPTVILLIGVDRAGRLWVRAEHVKTDLTIKDTAEGPGHETLVKDMAAKVGFPLKAAEFIAGHDIFGKKHTGLTIADEWSRDFPWNCNKTEIVTRIERVMTILSTTPPKSDRPEENDLPLLIVHTECEMLRYGMSMYRYADDGSGKPAKKQAAGVKDTCDAVGMAALIALEPRGPRAAKSSILTSASYAAMVKAAGRGQKVGYWIDPGGGAIDPATEEPRASERRSY